MNQTETTLPQLPAYTYRAHVVSVYDGDTFTINIDLGLGISMNGQKIRLFGFNTPEVRGVERPEGIPVRDYVRKMIEGRDVILRTHRDKKGKYGRWLGEVFFQLGEDMHDLGTLLESQGFAQRVDY